MKTEKYIRSLDDKDLEALFGDTGVEVPQELRTRTETTLEILSRLDEEREARPGARRPFLPAWVRWGSIAAALAVVVGAGTLMYSRLKTPRDTFDDPALAYAAVEQALMRVGKEMSTGMQLAQSQAPILQHSLEGVGY